MVSKGENSKLGLYISTVGILSGAMVLAISALQTRRSVNALATISEDIHNKLAYLKSEVVANNKSIKAGGYIIQGKTQGDEKKFTAISLKLDKALAEQNKILEGRDISAVGIDNAFQVLDQMKARLKSELDDFEQIAGRIWRMYEEGKADGIREASHEINIDN